MLLSVCAACGPTAGSETPDGQHQPDLGQVEAGSLDTSTADAGPMADQLPRPAWCPVQGSPASQDLHGAWSAPGLLVAVGAGGTMLRLDGTGWQATSAAVDLNGVWGASATNIFAVGEGGLVYRYDGTAWTDTVQLGSVFRLNAVWGFDDQAVYTGGDPPASTWLHTFDGSAWSKQLVSGTVGYNVMAIWGGAGVAGLKTLFFAGCIWDGKTAAVGSSLAGTKWSIEKVAGATCMYGLWGSGSTVFAVGGAGTILRHDGTGWSPMTSPTTATLRGVWGSSSTDVYAVGDGGVIVHHDGAAWSVVPSGTSQRLNAVTGSGPSEIWAVGQGGTVLRFDGQTTSCP